jgi:glycosyltransferase involved in cell wall biosynthesis
VALLNPITWAEPFGLVMIEALASGTPVIATPRGAAREIVDDGVTGFLRRTHDELVDAVGRIHEISRDACRSTVVHRFSTDRMVDGYLDLFTEVVDRTPPVAGHPAPRTSRSGPRARMRRPAIAS